MLRCAANDIFLIGWVPKLKIIYISSSTIPSRAANSIHVMKMCQAFTKNGHEVVLLAPDRQYDIEFGIQDMYSHYGVEACFEIIKLPWFSIKGRGYIYGLIAALKARKLKPDLIYCRNAPGCYFSTMLGMNVIFESHFPVEDTGQLDNWLFKNIIISKHLRKLVVITHALKDHYLEKYPFLVGTILVAPDGADSVQEGTKPLELICKEKKIQIGYVGHLYKGKGVELVAHLAQSCSWAVFHVVGGMERDVEFWRQKTSSENIFFHGYVPHSDVPRYLYFFDILLLPNQQKVYAHGKVELDIGKWTSPLKIFEYMASRRAIISSDLPVLKEVLTHEKNALLCTSDNVTEWVNALERLRDDKILRSRLADNAYLDFICNYTWHARAKKLIQEALS
jgi:glycosyltransferase involved in cell wall biosynthesis